MTNKIVYPYSEIKDKILIAADMIANPVGQTLSPKGGNVLFEDDYGNPTWTNDGATIARNITVKDPVLNYVINIIKHGSLKTNVEAGDGTTTTVVLTRLLLKEGFKLRDEGVNPTVLRKKLEAMADTLIEEIRKGVIQVKDDKSLESIATISSNNDKVIAKDVVRVVKFAGEDGMIFLEPNNKPETDVTTEPGFRIDSGMFAPELKTEKHRIVANYKDVPVFLTDKRIYYPEEAESILNTVLKAGYKKVVVVAQDFIGQAPNIFISNHTKGGVISVLLVRDTKVTASNSETLDDLATYLGGKVIKEKSGSLVNKITISDFVMANQVFADAEKTIITPKVIHSKSVKGLVASLKEELAKNKDDQGLKKRIASLTAGTTTIKVGGTTQLETTEKLHRYEDAINSTRSAMKDGYLVGGGIALIRAYKKENHDAELGSLVRRFTEGSIRQIAENCGKHADSMVETILSGKSKTFGYNALTDKYEDLLKAGVVDPFKVTEMAIRNAVSVSNALLSSNYIIAHEQEDKD
jgi:chaperonin GroEL